MKILGIELSSQRGSVAMVEEGRVVCEETWEEDRFRGQHIFQVLASMAGGLRDIEAIAVGRGPGRYSGLRTAMATAQGLALPSKKTIHAFSSGEALAYAMFTDSDISRIVVLGDARREKIWHAIFSRTNEGFAMEKTWSLSDAPSFVEQVPPDAICVSPDQARLLRYTLEGIEVREHFPTARDVALRAEERLRKGIPSEALAPIYMHPAVAKPVC